MMRRTPVVFLLAALAEVTPVSAQTAKQDELCVQLKECLGRLLGKTIEPPDSSLTQEQFCDILLEVYQGETGVQNICAVSQSGAVSASKTSQQTTKEISIDPKPKRNKKKGEKKSNTSNDTPEDGKVDPGRHLAAPACELPFDPVYADESGTDTPYDTYMLTIQDLFLLGGKLQRADTDAYATLKIGWATAHTAAALASEVPGGATIANEALSVVEIAVDQVDTHDATINSAQIEASLENSQKLVTQTCRMIDQIDGAERNFMNRFDHVDRTIKVVQTRLDKIDTVLNRLERDSAKIQQLLLTVLDRLSGGKHAKSKGKKYYHGGNIFYGGMMGMR